MKSSITNIITFITTFTNNNTMLTKMILQSTTNNQYQLMVSHIVRVHTTKTSKKASSKKVIRPASLATISFVSIQESQYKVETAHSTEHKECSIPAYCVNKHLRYETCYNGASH